MSEKNQPLPGGTASRKIDNSAGEGMDSQMAKFENGYPTPFQTNHHGKFPLEKIVEKPEKSEAGK